MEYNNYGLFRWNANNRLLYNENNHYSNILLHTGTVVKGEWENSICVTKVDNEPKIIAHSNHFLDGHEWDSGYNHEYKIFDNIVRNYTFAIQNKSLAISLDESKTYFYMIDPFSFSNSGHNMSIVLDQAHIILTHNLKHVLILKGYKELHNFKLLSLLLPPDIQFYELEINTLYKVKNLIVCYQQFYDIQRHRYLIDRMRQIIINKYKQKYTDCLHKNIILIKSNRNKNVMLKSTQLSCELLITALEHRGWIYIIPEAIDVFQLCIYLLFANKIVTSTGSIIYTNNIFFNRNAASIHLCSFYHSVAQGNLISNTLIKHTTGLNLNDIFVAAEFVKDIENYNVKNNHFAALENDE